MSKADKEWQRKTALRHIEQKRNEAFYTNRPIPSDKNMSAIGAKYVGSTPDQVARWMKAV